MKIKFQSADEFLNDYEAYKKGKQYKLLYKRKHYEFVFSRYVLGKYLKYEVELLQQEDNFVGVVDLRHMFEVVCKVE